MTNRCPRRDLSRAVIGWVNPEGEEHSLVPSDWTSRPGIGKTGMTKEEFELGYQGEKRRQRLRAVGLCLILLVAVIASSIVAYHIGWWSCAASTELSSYDRDSALEPGKRYKPIHDHVLYIGVLSPPGNFQQRQFSRQGWISELARAFPDGQIKLEFFIGQVPIQGNNMSSNAPAIGTQEERLLEERLQEEANWHGDICRVPVVESEVFDTDKVLWLVSNAVDWGARFVLKTMDDQKVMVDDALKKLQERPPTAPPVYFGKVWAPDRTPEGDGQKTWFFDGQCYGISGDVAYKIAVTHFNHSIAFPMYGTNSDDINMAKWIQFEDEIRKEEHLLSVKRLWLPSLCHRLVQLSVATPP